MECGGSPPLSPRRLAAVCTVPTSGQRAFCSVESRPNGAGKPAQRHSGSKLPHSKGVGSDLTSKHSDRHFRITGQNIKRMEKKRVDVRDVLRRRSDLSTFLVYLTRDGEKETAKGRLKAILRTGRVEARSILGQAKLALDTRGDKDCYDSQKCVCFTETPVEYVNLMLQELDGRQCQFKPCGIAITKMQGRKTGINPVWYVDMTPGHEWLTNNLDRLVSQALQTGKFNQSDVAAITPFIEQMGTWPKQNSKPDQKEFWWEREWRKVGDLDVPCHCIGFCPEDEIEEFEKYVQDEKTNSKKYSRVRFVDPQWSLEQIIACLAGIPRTSVDLV